MITVYGIANCNTVKAARAWLDAAGKPYTFHDFKKLGVPAPRLDAWLAALGWEALVNRRGTTWRQLDAHEREGIRDAASARAALLAHPTLIRRPVVEWADGRISAGFDAEDWAARR